MARRKPAPKGPPPRWYVNISPYQMLWKHDTPDEKAVQPGELIDLAHLTEGELSLFIRREHARPATDAEIKAHLRSSRS